MWNSFAYNRNIYDARWDSVMKRKRALKNFTPEVRRDLSWISVWMKVTSEKGFWWGFWDQSTGKDRVSEWRRDGSWNEWTDCYVEGGQRENGHVKRDRKKKGGNGRRPSSSSANIYLRICKDQTGYQKKLSRWYSLIKIPGTMDITFSDRT